MIALAMLFVLVACGQEYEGVTMQDKIRAYSEMPEDANDNNYTITATAHNDIELTTTTLTNEGQFQLRERIFMSDGELLHVGGDALDWYFYVFGFDHNFISINIIDALEPGVYRNWRNQFETGQRNWREFSLRALIEDINISIESMIKIQEEIHGIPMAEIDALVTWARSFEFPPTVWDHEALKALDWSRHIFSLSDIEALFSNDVNVIWAAFPGHGILHDNKAFSPEWLFNNTERALYGELIPLDEFQAVLDFAVNEWLFVNDITNNTAVTLQTAITAYNSPTPIPHELTFDLDTQRSGRSFADITPSGIEPIIINAWDGIVDSLEEYHDGFPTDGPTRPGYIFTGWYLDEDFRTPLTDTFRMPARDVTLYARWEQPTIHTITFDSGNNGTFADGETIITQDIVLGDNITAIPQPQPNFGYEFTGWLHDGANWPISSQAIMALQITEDITFTAQYEIDTTPTHTITFNSPNNALLITAEESGVTTVTQEVEIGNRISSVPEVRTDPGWVFEGWLQEGRGPLLSASQVMSLNITRDINFTAQLLNTPTVTATFNSGLRGTFADGQTTTTRQVGTGQSINDVPLVYTEPGYRLAGWIRNDTGSFVSRTSFVRPTEDISLTALIVADEGEYTFTLAAFNNGDDNNISLANLGVMRIWVGLNGINTLLPTADVTITAIDQDGNNAMEFVRVNQIWNAPENVNLIDVRKIGANWQYISLTATLRNPGAPGEQVVELLLINNNFVPTTPPTPTHTITFYTRDVVGNFGYDDNGEMITTMTFDIEDGNILPWIPEPDIFIPSAIFDGWLLDSTDEVFSAWDLELLEITEDMTFIAQYTFGGILDRRPSVLPPGLDR